jgi:hypothetical protein
MLAVTPHPDPGHDTEIFVQTTSPQNRYVSASRQTYTTPRQERSSNNMTSKNVTSSSLAYLRQLGDVRHIPTIR